MPRSARLTLCVLTFCLLFGSVLAEPITVKFWADGELIKNRSGAVIDADGRTIRKLRPSPTGEYQVDLPLGEKYLFTIDDGRLAQPSRMDARAIAPVTDVTLLPVPGAQGVPANDECSTAEQIAVGSSVTGTTLGATADAAPGCGTDITAPGVWYSIVGNGNTLNVSTCNTADYDTKLNVYCPDCATLICVDGNDDGTGCTGFTSDVSFDSSAGIEYLILVQGFSGSVGNFTLTVTDTGNPSTNPVACVGPPPLGACCNCLASPGNCTQSTEGQCLELTNDPTAWQGGDTPCATVGTATSYPSLNTPLAIPDAVAPGSHTPLVDTVTVPDSLIIGEASIEVDIRHTWIGDLIISITHNAKTVDLWVQTCNQGQFGNLITTFDDDGTASLCGNPQTPPPGNGDGNIPPGLVNGGTGFMSDFDGQDCAGDWTISVGDNYPADTGTLMAWAVNCAEGAQNCPDTSPPFDPNDCPDAPTSGGGDDDSDSDSDDSYNGFCADFAQSDDDTLRHFASTTGMGSETATTTDADESIRPRGLRRRTDRDAAEGR